jgi:mannosyltransferase OCH1-like enzyme
MNIAVLTYGQYRAAEECLENNILTLKSMFSEPSTTFHMYVLTNKEKSGNYSEILETYVKGVIAKHGINLKMHEFWEDFQDCYAVEDEIRTYIKTLAKAEGKESIGSLGLMEYRRYILLKRFEVLSTGIHYDTVVYNRIFDTSQKLLRPILPLIKEPRYSETLYFFMDNFFMGSKETMKRLLSFGSTTENYKPFVWTSELTQEFAEFDCVLAQTKPIFCQETQLFQYIRKTFKIWKSIRYDFNAPADTPNNKSAYLSIRFERINIIPKRILQIAIGDDYVRSLPLEDVKQHILQNHNTEYVYTLLTDDACKNFLKESFPEYSSLYTRLQKPQYKSDLIRYLYLYKNGGYYIDIDLLPLLPLYTIFESAKSAPLFFTVGAHTNSKKNTFELCNGFIGAKAGNPIFLELVKLMEQEPNPEDYGMNVKRLYKTIASRHSMTPFQTENSIYLFREVQHMGKYYIVNKKEIIVHSNGHGYPQKKV